MAPTKPVIYLATLFLSGIILFAVFFLNGCQRKEKVVGNNLIVSVSLLPHQYLIREIAGNDFTVNVLLPPGMNHHTYEPTPRQLIELERSSLLFINGFLPFEDKFVTQSGEFQKKIQVVKTTDGLQLLDGNACNEPHGNHEHHVHAADPHTWLSFTNARTESFNILNALCGINPDQAEKYRSNHKRFVVKIDSLHMLYQNKFKESGVSGFMIYHPALGYLARDYGLEQLAIENLGKNPTPFELRNLIDKAREKNFRIIFIQKEFDRENAEIIARETRARIVEINPLSDDWLTNFVSILNEILKKQN